MALFFQLEERNGRLILKVMWFLMNNDKAKTWDGNQSGDLKVPRY